MSMYVEHILEYIMSIFIDTWHVHTGHAYVSIFVEHVYEYIVTMLKKILKLFVYAHLNTFTEHTHEYIKNMLKWAYFLEHIK